MVEIAIEEMQDDEDCGFWIIMMAQTHCGKYYRGRYKVMTRKKGQGIRKKQKIHGKIIRDKKNL